VLVSRGLEAGEQVVTENTLLLARQYALLRDAVGNEPAAAAGAPPAPPADKAATAK